MHIDGSPEYLWREAEQICLKLKPSRKDYQLKNPTSMSSHTTLCEKIIYPHSWISEEKTDA